MKFIEVFKSVSPRILWGLTLALSLSFNVDASVSTQQKNAHAGETKTVSKHKQKHSASKRLQTLYSHLPQPDDLGMVFETSAKKYDIDSRLLLSMCVTESHLRKKVVSRYGAVGMCQVVPRYHSTTRSQMMNYRKNVDKAAEIIAELQEECNGNMKCVIHSYTVGKYAYKKGTRSPRYYAKVMKQYHRV